MRRATTSSPAILDGTPERHLYTGSDPERDLTIEDLRARAHRRLPRFALEYLEGGAEEEATLRHNREALDAWRFTPHALVDESERDLSVPLFGRDIAMPLLIAPTGLNGVFWAEADLRLAQAAAGAGIPFVQSTMSNMRMEEIARVPGLRHWWQLYVFGPWEATETLVARARDAGCEALVVTTDDQIYGNREWDSRNSTSPGHLSWGTKLESLRHPRWLVGNLLTHGMPSFPNILDFVPKDKHAFFESAFWVRGNMDVALDWDGIARLRNLWPRRLLLKGLLHPEDVERAIGVGADGVILSNHGGRQLDWAVSPLDVLPEARRIAGDRLTLLADGGIRRGTDALKMLALGADAVLVGRATLYGVAAGGRAGAARALEILRKEMDHDLGLLGATSVRELGLEFLRR